MEAGLNRGTWARDLNVSPAEQQHLKGTPLLTMKPCLFVANLSEAELDGGSHYAALKELAAARRWPVVPILGDLEVELQAFSPRSARNFWPVWVLPKPAWPASSGSPPGCWVW